jgi:quinol monooxygenase YgiN
MSGYVIIVDFRLRPGSMDAFRELVDANAADSCRLESGCRRFDVLVPVAEPDRIVLYEIYNDRDAFEAHLNTPHFASFNRESSPLVATKSVSEFALGCEGSATATL